MCIPDCFYRVRREGREFLFRRIIGIEISRETKGGGGEKDTRVRVVVLRRRMILVGSCFAIRHRDASWIPGISSRSNRRLIKDLPNVACGQLAMLSQWFSSPLLFVGKERKKKRKKRSVFLVAIFLSGLELKK